MTLTILKQTIDVHLQYLTNAINHTQQIDWNPQFLMAEIYEIENNYASSNASFIPVSRKHFQLKKSQRICNP